MKDYNLFNIYLDKDSKSKYNRHFFKLRSITNILFWE